MAIAYVLITAEAGREHDVHKRLLQVAEIRELVPLFGDYDLICKVDAADLENLEHTVLTRIRGIPGVNQTRTLTTTQF